jgi:hypothetical protein
MGDNGRFTNQVRGIGCGYLLKLTIGIIVLMIANSYLIGLLVQSNLYLLPEFLKDVRVFQFSQILFPFLMVVVQFWIYDWIRDRYREQTER